MIPRIDVQVALASAGPDHDARHPYVMYVKAWNRARAHGFINRRPRSRTGIIRREKAWAAFRTLRNALKGYIRLRDEVEVGVVNDLLYRLDIIPL